MLFKKAFLWNKTQIITALAMVVGFVYLHPSKAVSQDDVAADTVITVTMKNFKFVPNHLQIPTGEEVRLKFQNKGSVTHAFMAGNHLTEELEGYKDGLFSGVEVTKKVNGKMTKNTYGSQSLMLGVKPGKTATLRFSMPQSKSGTYEFGCFKTAGTNGSKHYSVGMKGTLQVGEQMSAKN